MIAIIIYMIVLPLAWMHIWISFKVQRLHEFQDEVLRLAGAVDT